LNRTLTVAAVIIMASSLAPASAEQPTPGDWQRTFNVGAGDMATAGENPYFILKPGSRLTLEGKEEVAMDRAQIVSVGERVTTPAGTFEKCLKTEETTPLEPGDKEYKLYAPGVGLVRDGPLVLISRSLK
jgi:hypothetical protein